MNCPRCGRELVEKSARCPHCGDRLRYRRNLPNMEDVAISAGRRSMATRAAIAAIAVAAIVIVSFFAVSSFPLCRVEVVLVNSISMSGYTVHVGIYFDQDLKDEVYIAPSETYRHTYMLTRGPHVVGFDYSYWSGSEDIDGLVEAEKSFTLLLFKTSTVSYYLAT